MFIRQWRQSRRELIVIKLEISAALINVVGRVYIHTFYQLQSSSNYMENDGELVNSYHSRSARR